MLASSLFSGRKAQQRSHQRGSLNTLCKPSSVSVSGHWQHQVIPGAVGPEQSECVLYLHQGLRRDEGWGRLPWLPASLPSRSCANKQPSGNLSVHTPRKALLPLIFLLGVALWLLSRSGLWNPQQTPLGGCSFLGDTSSHVMEALSTPSNREFPAPKPDHYTHQDRASPSGSTVQATPLQSPHWAMP